MCVICISEKGARQPNRRELETMFANNPDGAGFMYARNGKVYISKGYMDVKSFLGAISRKKFTDEDSVVYHCRIATQGGVNPGMTHPFAWTTRIEDTKVLDCKTNCGIAHNGVIRLTSFKGAEYSDTAYFITNYLTKLIRNKGDLKSNAVLDMIDELTYSKWAIMDCDGYVARVGNFIESDGLYFSNGSFIKTRSKK